jgi:hypothetical protein
MRRRLAGTLQASKDSGATTIYYSFLVGQGDRLDVANSR